MKFHAPASVNGKPDSGWETCRGRQSHGSSGRNTLVRVFLFLALRTNSSRIAEDIAIVRARGLRNYGIRHQMIAIVHVRGLKWPSRSSISHHLMSMQ
jgi:hypothetical protein